MKRSVLGSALLLCGGMAQAIGWADLWSRPEQQTIAQRQQAYAEIQGQQYAQAAQHLAPYKDPVSLYNRGNALAHAGDLQAALSALDAVLKDPATGADLRRDAQHNRDLVAQQLQSQSDKGDKSGEGDKSGNGDKGGKSDKDSGQDSNAKPGGPGDKAKPDGNAKPDSNAKPESSAKQDGKENGSEQAPGSDKGQSKDGRQRDGPSRGDQQADTAKGGDKMPDPQQAQGQGQRKPPLTGQAQDGVTQSRDASSAAQTEQAQSLDQWLRWIPDDPSGLLRRKFMIEHMLNQHEGQQ